MDFGRCLSPVKKHLMKHSIHLFTVTIQASESTKITSEQTLKQLMIIKIWPRQIYDKWFRRMVFILNMHFKFWLRFFFNKLGASVRLWRWTTTGWWRICKDLQHGEWHFRQGPHGSSCSPGKPHTESATKLKYC